MMKRTILYDEHLALKAKMVDFAGWEMPVQYTGIKDETAAVREAQGMFDVSHMGEIRVAGTGAGEFLDYVLSRKISLKNPELTNYAFLCYEDGGVVDDLMVYQLDTEDYWLVVNAANTDKDFAHLQEILTKYEQQNEISISNETDNYGLIAIQGTGSLIPTLNALTPIYPALNISEKIGNLKRFRQVSFPLNDKHLVVSRTGYTGEDGYEVYLPADDTTKLWRNLLKENIKPCGLGARDALRLEAGLPLYGHELSSQINPLEAGLGKFVELDRDFVGKAMMGKQQRKSIALISEDKSIPRDGYQVFFQDQEIGYITSGSFSPTLNKGIAFALVTADLAEGITEVEVAIRRKKHTYKITTTPFV
ncbi:MAG TPA: glycine cleavage system aminomethyltransferase GcvT [Clostridiaceae bacterium]|nr:glycine cleavage system aminomethyltransferase GcvT [Clostridiaceae bacterium]